MNRKVLLVEPNYSNKYPPMGLMKLATYYRKCGDDVRFFKGDMRNLAAELICEDLLNYLEVCFSDVYWRQYYPTLFDFIKLGKYSILDVDPVFEDEEILDALKEKGWDLSENGTLSVSNSIKNITEDTADILASYLNSIRLDCSVNRENLRLILVAVQSVPEMNNIARSQLTQLTTLVTLAEARNSKLDDMYSWMNKVTNGVLKISMK